MQSLQSVVGVMIQVSTCQVFVVVIIMGKCCFDLTLTLNSIVILELFFSKSVHDTFEQFFLHFQTSYFQPLKYITLYIPPICMR